MPATNNELYDLPGLPSSQIALLQRKFGKNAFNTGTHRSWFSITLQAVKEPMFILLTIACTVYFLLGQSNEGLIMLGAMVIVACISVLQDGRSERALQALQAYALPKAKVIRDGQVKEVNRDDIVPGDILLVEEGSLVAADGQLLSQNDLSVDESILTGESFPVIKDLRENSQLFQGTTISSGKGVVKVTATGGYTALGKIGNLIQEAGSGKTKMETEVRLLTRRLALFGLISFIAIFIVDYLQRQQWSESLLLALTLAMSAIPEEIPVAFTSFVALGALRLSKKGVISRRSQLVPLLGSIDVLCLDKTGTITENKMSVAAVYLHGLPGKILDHPDDWQQAKKLLYLARLASEEKPFDPMEQAIIAAHERLGGRQDMEEHHKIFEYPLEGRPPMMTHIYRTPVAVIAAAKGGSVHVLKACRTLSDGERKTIELEVDKFTRQGYRVLGVASANAGTTYPASQDDFDWTFAGLVALHDPPKINIPDQVNQFRKAGIEVKMITGDDGRTAANIAQRVGLSSEFAWITGDEVMRAGEAELSEMTMHGKVFARMYPEAKLKVIQSLRKQGKNTAMIGDGVNDGPALKAASVGIAVGRSGTETARQAADIILTDDDLEKVVTGIKEGRRITVNFGKATSYIISIHIPVILTVTIPVIFSWKYYQLLTPVHVIFLELIMGPTCSLFFEKEAVASNLILQPPAAFRQILSLKKLSGAIVYGIIAAFGLLLSGYQMIRQNQDIGSIRDFIFTTIVMMNLFMTFSGKSSTLSIENRTKNPYKYLIIAGTLLFILVTHFIPFLRSAFGFSAFSVQRLLAGSAVAVVFSGWRFVFPKMYPVPQDKSLE